MGTDSTDLNTIYFDFVLPETSVQYTNNNGNLVITI